MKTEKDFLEAMREALLEEAVREFYVEYKDKTRGVEDYLIEKYYDTRCPQSGTDDFSRLYRAYKRAGAR